MNKYFLDFGTNLGQGLEAISDIEKFDKDVEVHSFEANPFIFQKINFKEQFTQDNISISKKNVLRGLHLQLNPKSQLKLVQVLKGKVTDVIVDLRKNFNISKLSHTLLKALMMFFASLI